MISQLLLKNKYTILLSIIFTVAILTISLPQDADASHPRKVTNLTGTVGDGSVNLEWDAPQSGTTPQDYIIQYKETTDNSWITVTDGVSTRTNAEVTNLENDISYDFKVAAKKLDNHRLRYSDTITVMPEDNAIEPGTTSTSKSVFTYQIPLFEDWDEVQKESTSRSYVSNISYDLDEKGEAKLYARDRSSVTYPQASIEYVKEITVKAGDELEITQKTFLKKARFYNQDSGENSHVVAIPTIHKVGESDIVGYTNQTGCDSKPIFVEIIENVRNIELTSTLSCDSLEAGTYEISAYVHARANENSDRENASTYAIVKDIELSVKRTR